jgi:hypothetical protein
MKKVNLKGKLSLSKSIISRLEMDQISGGAKTDISNCGTLMATLPVCCGTLNKVCNTIYAVCGTGPVSYEKC